MDLQENKPIDKEKYHLTVEFIPKSLISLFFFFYLESCCVKLSHTCPQSAPLAPSTFFPLRRIKRIRHDCINARESSFGPKSIHALIILKKKKKRVIPVPMIRGTLYVSHIPLLPPSLLTISNPGLRHHLIIISGQWDTLIALSCSP